MTKTTLHQTKRYFLLLAVFIFLAFVSYSYLVAKETFTQLDFDLTVKFQDRIPQRFDYPFSLLSVIGSAEISMLLWLIISIYLFIRRFWLTFFSMILLPAALFLEIFGKVFVYHPGPPYMFYRGVTDFNFPSHFIKTNYSYPSGHMLRTAFLATFFITYLIFRSGFKNQVLIIPSLIVFLILMIVSRIYLGEHWTTDVIGGLLLGVSTGLLAGVTIPIKKSKMTKVIEQDMEIKD